MGDGVVVGAYTAEFIWQVKASLQEVEYSTFAIANEKSRRLCRRCLGIVNQLSLGERTAKPPLRVVLLAAVHLLQECLNTSAAVPKTLLGFSLGHLFQGLYHRLRRAWGSCPPSWQLEDERDANLDNLDSISRLSNKDAWSPCHYGVSELWGFLEKLPESKDIVTAKLTRQGGIIDFNDVENEELLCQGAYTTVTTASYRGSRIVLKEINPEQLEPNESQEIVLEGTAWVKLCHPHIVPVIGFASTRVSRDGTSPPQLCAVLASLYAPGNSLQELWCTQGHIPTPAQLLVLCRQVAEALLYIGLYDQEACYHVRELPLDNVIIDSYSGAARVLPTMALTNKQVSRWQPPQKAGCRECYMVGMLLWCAVAHSVPLPHLNKQESIKAAVEEASWHPQVGPLAGLQCFAAFISKCCALEGEDGFATLPDLLVALERTLADVLHEADSLPLQLSSSPIPLLDKYGAENETAHPLHPLPDSPILH